MQLTTFIRRAVCAAALLVAAGSALAAPVAGRDFVPLSRTMPVQDPSKQEVIEFFWYGCGHCNTINPAVVAWKAKLPKDVTFRRIHINWNESSREGHVKLFLTLQQMGIEEKLAPAIFNAIHKEGVELRREADLYAWLAKQKVDVARFKAIYTSLSLNLHMSKLAQLTRDYQVKGVPMFIVNGKVQALPLKGQPEASVLKSVDALLAQARASKPR